jgi:hypothetical protein
MCASVAWAVSNVQVSATGPRAGETTLRLFDPGGKPVAADASDSRRFSNLAPGAYTAEVLVGGKPVGSRSTVRLDDGDNELRVDSRTGAVEVIRRVARMQQQQQDGLEFGIFGGWKRTPFDGRFESTALGADDSRSFKTDATNLSVEARYNFRAAREMPDTRFFVFGGYTHYFDADERKRFLDLHPTPGNDSGIAVDERYSWTMGLGARWMLSSTVGLEAMLGAHATRTRVDALSDESCCGGPDNRFRRSRTDWGPMAGIGLRCRLGQLGSGRPLTGVLRYTAMKVDDIEVSGRSAFGFDYGARVNGGWNHSVQVGLTF